MSVQRTNSQPSYPAVTTTTNTTTTTTTTTTINSEKAKVKSTQPSLAPRLVGWHAKESGFDWNKRSDQHRYRLSSGLPEVHAAVINHDWDTAGEMLCAEDIGLLWLPTVSQQYSATAGKFTESASWALKLPSKHKRIQLEAIRQMAIDSVPKTEVDGTCMYGANLLTLCLQTSAPQEFMEKLLTMIAKHAPQYLNLPDASGRTPLYIAVNRSDEAQVQMLLDAGASPHAACRFPAAGLRLSDLSADDTPFSKSKLTSTIKKLGHPSNHSYDEPDSALSRSDSGDDECNSINELYLDDDPVPTITAFDSAVASENNNIFSLLVAHSIQSLKFQDDYPIILDPLKLQIWASLHTEDEIRTLASQFNSLKSYLFNLKDKSGTSIVDRSLARKEPLDKDVTPLFNKDPEAGALYAAAAFADTEAFVVQLNIYLEQPLSSFRNIAAETLIKMFLSKCDPYGIPQLLAQCPKLEPFLQIFIGNPSELLDLPLENFTELIEAIWPTIPQADREFIARWSGHSDARYTQVIIDLPGFTMARNTLPTIKMAQHAAESGNTTAFEFAAAHQDDFEQIASGIRPITDSEGAIRIRNLAVSSLCAGSLIWFEKCMATGFNLQPLIDSHGEVLLPRMADLSPARLSTWLDGKNFNITPQMIDEVQTPEGRDALLKLIKQEKADPEKTDTEKADS